VYSISNLKSPIASYKLDGGPCFLGIISEKYLYLGGWQKLQVFEVTKSLTQPLIPVKVIKAVDNISSILRVGDELILGQGRGYLEIFDV
jgi:hypothetical protein